MRDVHDRERQPLEQVAEVVLQAEPERPVERAERLVEQQDIRTRRERPCERDALRLAARERRDDPVLGSGEADQLQCLGDP